MTYKCAGVDITPEVLRRVSASAGEWSANPALTHGQQALARALEQEAARLAEATAPSGSEIDFVKKTCCHLLAAVHGGKLPERSQWPCSARSAG